jgi:hypothetical protein
MTLEPLVRERRLSSGIEQEHPVLHRREDLIPDMPGFGRRLRLSLELLDVQTMLGLSPPKGTAQRRSPDPHAQEEPGPDPHDDRRDPHTKECRPEVSVFIFSSPRLRPGFTGALLRP